MANAWCAYLLQASLLLLLLEHFPNALVRVCCIAVNPKETSFSHGRKEITVVDMTKVDVASHAANTN